jgi:integrase
MWKQENRGKLRLYERYIDLDGNEHKVSVPLASNSARDYKEAVSQLMLKMSEVENGADEIRLEDAIKKYLAKTDIKHSTKATYESAFRSLVEIFGNPHLSKLTNVYVRRQLSECDLSIHRKNYDLSLLKTLIRFAVDYGYAAELLTVRPFRDPKRKESIEDKYLTSEELASVLDQLYSMQYYLAKFLVLTGCRFGEAVALAVDDYDGKYITISKTAWQGTIQSAKTESSERQIYVQEELRKLLAEYLPFRNTLLMARGVRTDLLFFNRDGNLYSNYNFNRQLQKVECDKKLHAHIFRHTHASLLAEAGYSLEDVSKRLGHADSEITKKIYLHTTDKMKERAEKQLDKIRLID